MQKSIRKLSAFIIVILVIGVSIPGCNPTGRFTQPGKGQSGNEQNIQSKEMGNGETESRIYKERVKMIKREIASQKNVKSSSVVITDETVIIGLILSRYGPGTSNRGFFREIEGRVRKLDSSINGVVITTNVELCRKICHIEGLIADGTPLDLLACDITDVLRDVGFAYED